MIIINGVNIYPSQIEECIYKHLNSATNYLIHITTDKAIKKLTVDIEIQDEIINNKSKLINLEKSIVESLKASITITPKIKFIPLKTIPENRGKSKRILFE